MKPGDKTPLQRTKLVACPGCGGDSVYAPSNPFRPFCSERCRNIDLGAWASENFRIPERDLPENQVTEEKLRSSASH